MPFVSHLGDPLQAFGRRFEAGGGGGIALQGPTRLTGGRFERLETDLDLAESPVAWLLPGWRRWASWARARPGAPRSGPAPVPQVEAKRPGPAPDVVVAGGCVRPDALRGRYLPEKLLVDVLETLHIGMGSFQSPGSPGEGDSDA